VLHISDSKTRGSSDFQHALWRVNCGHTPNLRTALAQAIHTPHGV
jgi:hypothetical protein